MTARHLAAPLPPTVLDAIRDTPVAPFLDRPTEQVLAQIGLPALPQLPALPPLPGLPPLPTIDPAALIKPVTDLFSGFGNGNLGANGAHDPQVILQKVSQSISAAMQLATTGLQLLQSMQSAGSRAATTAAVETAATSTAISGQATQMNAITAGAAGTVATGYLQMAAVATRFALTTAALGPTLVTPAGQGALLATAIEAGAEAMAITAHTKAQLAGQSAQMARAGTPVSVRKPSIPKPPGLGKAPQSLAKGLISGKPSPVTPGHAPGGLSAKSAPTANTNSADSSRQVVQQLVQLVQPLITAARQVGHEVTAQMPAKPATDTPAPVPNRTGTGGVVGTSSGHPITAAPVASATAPLGAWQTESVVATTSPGTSSGPTTVATARVTGEMLPPVVPGTGALATASARSRAIDAEVNAMVDTCHVDELVDGPPAETTAPVIGVAPSSTKDNPYSL
ncbi:hypothetical protein [Nocardia xishanensis]|uniref:hypothetical protein n=1 Tax=Nocardia xishanensis TaxID=238964 RepID=UPI00082D722B|nr:hypothetical protein [Nocardia xishanensis]